MSSISSIAEKSEKSGATPRQKHIQYETNSKRIMDKSTDVITNVDTSGSLKHTVTTSTPMSKLIWSPKEEGDIPEIIVEENDSQSVNLLIPCTEENNQVVNNKNNINPAPIFNDEIEKIIIDESTTSLDEEDTEEETQPYKEPEPAALNKDNTRPANHEIKLPTLRRSQRTRKTTVKCPCCIDGSNHVLKKVVNKQIKQDAKSIRIPIEKSQQLETIEESEKEKSNVINMTRQSTNNFSKIPHAAQPLRDSLINSIQNKSKHTTSNDSLISSNQIHSTRINSYNPLIKSNQENSTQANFSKSLNYSLNDKKETSNIRKINQDKNKFLNVSHKLMNVIESCDNLEMKKDNYICFISADGTVFNEMIMQVNDSDTLKEANVVLAFENLKNQLIKLKINSCSVSQGRSGIKDDTWVKIKEIMRDIFQNTEIVITICKDKIITPEIDDRKKIIKECHESPIGGHKAVPLKQATADEIARGVVENLITKYGSPKAILTDQGAAFMGKIMRRLAKAFKI
ncbi:hypothetical protein PV326_000644 [Microctonus aethiopoides]|nr:hypothetical protein PV326_000644 [Microctonus aethiopoides]